MPFYPNSQADLQSRRAIIATDTGQFDTPLPSFTGKDVFFGAAGERWPVDAPNPSFAVLVAQNRAAQLASNTSQFDTPLPALLGKDKFFGPAGQGPNYDYPNPSFAIVARQNVVARTATDVGQFDTPLPSFVGTDSFFAGRGAGPDYDYPNPSFASAPTRAFVSRLSADAGQWDAPIPLLAGVAAAPPGAQSTDLTPRVQARARDYSQTGSFPLELIGQDARNAGAQAFDLPPKAAARPSTLHEFPSTSAALLLSVELPIGQASVDAQYRSAPRSRDYSVTASFFAGLIGQDAVNPGVQLSGNAPAGYRRATEYTWLQSFPLFLIGRDQMATGVQAQDLPTKAAARTFALYDPGVNAALSLAQPSGQAAQDAQYRLTPRLRDYTFTAVAFGGLAGKDAFNAGAQLSGNAPSGALRASTLSETGSNQVLFLTAAPPVFPQGLAALDSQYRAVPRSRDYTQVSSFPLELIGRDTFFGVGGPAYDWTNPSFARLTGAQQLAARLSADVGQWASPLPELVGLDRFFGTPGESQAFDWTPPVRSIARSFALYDPGTNLTIALPVAVVALPAGAQAQDLPIRVIARASSLSDPGAGFTNLPLSLVLPAGTQSTDLPTKAPARLRDYGQTFAFPLELIGKDALTVGDSTASSELPPKGAPRASDYTWLQSLPLYVYQQLPPGKTTEATALPPKAPQRATEYTWLQSLKPYLIGRDALYGAPGEVPAYDWQNPRGPARLVDYTFLQGFSVPLESAPPVFPVGAQIFDVPPAGALRLTSAGYSHTSATPFSLVARTRDIIHVIGTPQGKWIVGRIPLSSRWRIGSPRR